MMKQWREVMAGEGDGPGGRAHRALLAAMPEMARTPAALRGRIMDGVRGAEREGRGVAVWWGWAAVAATVVIAAGVVWRVGPGSGGVVPEVPGMTALPRAVGAEPMLRLVSSRFDEPIREEARKIYDDTRRATTMVVRCVPFVRGGG